LETAALTGVDALTAREVGSVSMSRIETGGEVNVIDAGPTQPANPPIMPAARRRKTTWRHFMM
jgi:hypothetical protein